LTEPKDEFVATTRPQRGDHGNQGGAYQIRAVRHPDGSVSFWATIGAPDLCVVLDPEDAERLAGWLRSGGR